MLEKTATNISEVHSQMPSPMAKQKAVACCLMIVHSGTRSNRRHGPPSTNYSQMISQDQVQEERLARSIQIAKPLSSCGIGIIIRIVVLGSKVMKEHNASSVAHMTFRV